MEKRKNILIILLLILALIQGFIIFKAHTASNHLAFSLRPVSTKADGYDECQKYRDQIAQIKKDIQILKDVYDMTDDLEARRNIDSTIISLQNLKDGVEEQLATCIALTKTPGGGGGGGGYKDPSSNLWNFWDPFSWWEDPFAWTEWTE